jgi:Zn-finger nucleic acid-binding protein/RNA polymerase subunit RPABC4/transcription elongation factor Spt4
MTDVQSLHCPNCGAAVDPQAARCPYCRARLAAISCPHCFALMFQGSAFCPKCGAHSSRAASGPSTKVCPGCRSQLAQVLLGDLPILECAACDGVWVGAADFERICANREAQAAVLERRRSTVPADARRTPIHYRPCLVCGKMMNRVNFGRVSGTVIDVCRGHGTFLDAGELHAIATFIMDGGLDLARQREKDDLVDERHRLALLKAQIEHQSHGTDWEHRSKFGDSLFEIRRLLKDE